MLAAGREMMRIGVLKYVLNRRRRRLHAFSFVGGWPNLARTGARTFWPGQLQEKRKNQRFCGLWADMTLTITPARMSSNSKATPYLSGAAQTCLVLLYCNIPPQYPNNLVSKPVGGRLVIVRLRRRRSISLVT